MWKRLLLAPLPLSVGPIGEEEEEEGMKMKKSCWEDSFDMFKGGGDLSAEYKDPTGKQVQSQTKGAKLGELIEQHHKGQQVAQGATVAAPVVGADSRSREGRTKSPGLSRITS